MFALGPPSYLGFWCKIETRSTTRLVLLTSLLQLPMLVLHPALLEKCPCVLLVPPLALLTAIEDISGSAAVD